MVVPLFNSESTIEQAINSARPLLEEGAQIVFVDNVSTDAGPALAMRLARDYSSILGVCHTPGPGLARNHGIALCDRKFVTFLDADDELVASGIFELLRRMSNEKVSVGRTSVEVIQAEASRREGPRFIRPNLNCHEIYDFQKKVTGVHGVVYQLNLLRQRKILFPSGFIAEDLAFNLQLSRHGVKVIQTQKIGYRYFLGVEGQISRNPFSPSEIVRVLTSLNPNPNDSHQYRKAYWTIFLRSYFGALGHVRRREITINLWNLFLIVFRDYRELLVVISAGSELGWNSRSMLKGFLERLLLKRRVRFFFDANNH